ncbi:unnamed protein product [Moneuplotes crassus]|uniref:Uncharacterized protein n=1 Tax=Euplotes crassus TaxID=5936 RepID=A0AAD1XYU1_EUPCR|nr:unnamed protein product [Moneuplotes crassus]
MNVPACDVKKCKKESKLYLSNKNMYLCEKCFKARYWGLEFNHIHKYPKEEFVNLIDPEDAIETIDNLHRCTQILLEGTETFDEEHEVEECKALAARYEEEVRGLRTKLQASQSNGSYYEFTHLADTAQDILRTLKNEDLLRELAVIKLLEQSDDANVSADEIAKMKRQLKKDYDDKIYENREIAKEYSQNLLDNDLLKKKLADLKEKHEKSEAEKDRIIEEIIAENKKLTDELAIEKQKTMEVLEDRDQAIFNAQQAKEEADKLKEEIKAKDSEIQQIKAPKHSLKIPLLQPSSLRSITPYSISPKPPSAPTRLSLSCYSYSEFESFLDEITGENWTFGSDTYNMCGLPLSLYDTKQMKVLVKLKKRVPDVKFVDISYIPVDNEEAKELLATYFPNKVKELSFNYNSSLGCISYYYEALLSVASCVFEEVVLYNFKISQSQAVSLLSAFRHVKVFTFGACTLTISSVPDMEDLMNDSHITRLGLGNCGNESHGNWSKDSNCFQNLMAGLAKSRDFKTNILMVKMWDSDLEKSNRRTILDNCGLRHVET